MAGKVHPFFDQSNFWLTLATALTLGVTSGALGDWLHDDVGLPRFWIWAVGFGLFAGAAFYVRARLRKAFEQTNELSTILRHLVDPRKARGLIVMVGVKPGSDTARDAIAYHGSTLRHLWLITTSEAKTEAEAIFEDVRARLPDVNRLPIEVLKNPYGIEEAFELVAKLRKQAIRREGVREADLICDFTGLPKGSSAGMVLACAGSGARLQYMVSEQLDERRRGTGPSLPIELAISYSVSEE